MGKITENSPRIPFKEYPRAPDLEMSFRIMLGRGIFERTSFREFMKYTPKRDVAVEVGSHVGSWTLGLSKLFQRVVGFEPQPVNRQYLEKNIDRANAKNITIHPYAVVSRLNQEFCISASGETRNSGMAHLIPRIRANDNMPPVRCVRLDDILATDPGYAHSSIDALKIDVEGMELEVLRGGVQTIKANRPTILLEINERCTRYGFSKEDILDQMNDLGYREAERTRNDYIFVPN
jgi:FkbM family methyltransferase